MEHGRARSSARGQLGILLRDRGGHHQLSPLGDVGRVVAQRGLDPGLPEPREVRGLRLVGARDLRAELAGHERESAHARAADADEVQPPSAERGGLIRGCLHRRRP